ncbi:MAG: LiaI-LiaF-like domain-containing protein [Acidobacteriota bacterium]
MSGTPQTPRQPGSEAGKEPATPAAYSAYYQKNYFPDDPRRKSPALAAMLSLLPGLGQVYLGYYQQGFVNVLVIAALIAYLASDAMRGLVVFAAFFMVFFWLYNIVDAARRASLYNQMLAGLGPTQLPEDIQAPGTKGSLIGGLALIVFGALMFAHTKFNFSLDWLEDWWPIALVFAGVYLIYSWMTRGQTKTGTGPES